MKARTSNNSRFSSFGYGVTIRSSVKQNVKAISPIQDRGASMVEFALLLALIAIIAIIGVKVLGHKTANTFCKVTGHLEEAGNPNLRYNPTTGQCEDSTLEN
jgi:Flp pilus assembly pilin Flp